MAAAYLVNFPAWGQNCGRLSAIFRERYGMTASDTVFFDGFAAPAPEFEQSAREVIQRGLDAGVDPAWAASQGFTGAAGQLLVMPGADGAPGWPCSAQASGLTP